MDKILQIITNSTWIVTKLVGSGPVAFGRPLYEVAVQENTQEAPLFQLKAQVQEKGTTVHYSIREGNDNGYFSIDHATGQIKLKQPLDFEEAQEHELVVEARVGEDRSETRVMVRVLDVNDHYPTFPRTLYETQITEEDDRHLPKTILKVTATDGDAGQYGQLRYSLVEEDEDLRQRKIEGGHEKLARPKERHRKVNKGGKPRANFSIGAASGEIYLLAPLDRDPPNGRSRWRLRVTASDGELETETTVHINLKDINDNSPYFPKTTVEASISENTPQGETVTTVSATDHDDPSEGNNARLVYSIEKNVIDEASGRPIFDIDSEDGRVTTALCCLDREKTPSYAIQVVATDGGGLKGTGTVSVTVWDVNDVPPRFSRPEWTLDVSEAAKPEDTLATLTVVDPDVTNEFNYRVVEESGKGWERFLVVTRSDGGGDLRAKTPLNYEDPEQREGFRFRVQVTDMGNAGWTDKYHVDGTWVNLNLVDANDNTPVFHVSKANLTLPEDTPLSTPLATFTASDNDKAGLSQVSYSIDAKSDPDRVFMVDASGNVRLHRHLDREKADHHEILVLAIDDGEPPRTATATLLLNVTDVNDNPPFISAPRSVTVEENSPPRRVAEVILGDPDSWRENHGPPFTIALDPHAPPHILNSVNVEFNYTGDGGRGVGIVSTLKPLDREERRALLVPLVVGDTGAPPQTATVTLTINVGDINDNKMAPATKTVQVFRFQDPHSPVHHFSRQHHHSLVSDTTHPHEQQEHLLHQQGSTAQEETEQGDPDLQHQQHQTQTHRQQHVLLHRPDLIPLGGVYVSDPDDWDSDFKSYSWRIHGTHPLFVLNNTSGQLAMRTAVDSGRYVLGFSVSDSSQGQSGVPANVTVIVKEANPADVSMATPITLRATPTKLLSAEQGTPSILQTLVEAAREWVAGEGGGGGDGGGGGEAGHWDGAFAGQVEAVAVQEVTPRPFATFPSASVAFPVSSPEEDSSSSSSSSSTDTIVSSSASPGGGSRSVIAITRRPDVTSRVWLTSAGPGNLQHLLFRHKEELEEILGVQVVSVGLDECLYEDHPGDNTCTIGCRTRVVAGPSFSVVDANTSAVAGPRMQVVRECGCSAMAGSLPAALFGDRCHPSRCLNGGRCVKDRHGPRCICPHGTTGSRCKVLTRHFQGGVTKTASGTSRGGSEGVSGGWAWLPSLPTCSEIHITLELLTASTEGRLLYAGPDHHPPPMGQTPRSDMLSLEMSSGRPQLMLDLGTGTSALVLNTTYSLADNKWHRIDIVWKNELVEMIVDLCSGSAEAAFPSPSSTASSLFSSSPTTSSTASSASSSNQPSYPPEAHTCRGAARLAPGARILNTDSPLHVGGLAHPAPSHRVYQWPSPLLTTHFSGCIRNLRVNGQLQDLGVAVLGEASTPGCPALDCMAHDLPCGPHGRCNGHPGQLWCECDPGWIGKHCSDPTVPASFDPQSYVKLALSFTPFAYTTSLHLRFRTWERAGQLIVLASQHGRDRFALELVEGELCLNLLLHPDPVRQLCLSSAHVTDGKWHTAKAARHGTATLLALDDGEGDLYNASMSLEGRQLLDVDKQEGVYVGGTPEYIGVSVFQVHSDYHNGCIDDVRISSKPVPVPPAVNGTTWGQATMFRNVHRGCRAPPACANVTCNAPFTCVDTWRNYYCGCSEGKVLSTSKSVCEDEDECSWAPCLNGGSCINRDPGYVCACPQGFAGQHCHLPDPDSTSLKLSLGALVAIVVWCTFLLLLICAFLLHQHHKRAALRKGLSDVRENVLSYKEEQSAPSCNHTPNLLELKLLHPPKAVNGQAAWIKNPNIADVDVLQVDAASVTSSLEERRGGNTEASGKGSRSSGTGTSKSTGGLSCVNGGDGGGGGEGKGRGKGKGGGTGGALAGDDLRYYAYEGDNSSPGSLSSCTYGRSGKLQRQCQVPGRLPGGGTPPGLSGSPLEQPQQQQQQINPSRHVVVVVDHHHDPADSNDDAYGELEVSAEEVHEHIGVRQGESLPCQEEKRDF